MLVSMVSRLVPLQIQAYNSDFALCALSIAIAIMFHPLLILRKLWPYLSILASFGYFVYWNGGVVLGDKTNHVATIHLPQLLYLWPFISFFSFPLLIPSLVRFLTPRSLPPPSRILSTLPTLAIALLATLATIHYNTLIHPFTLADNRHYMFYIFRYSILSHPSIRYLLAPIYILAFYLCYTTLLPPQPQPPTPAPAPISIARTPAARKTLAQIQRRRHQPPPQTARYGEGVSTSWFLVWILATGLSLVTAPLVEPRYFIVPWVMWRLHVPLMTYGAASSGSGPSAGVSVSVSKSQRGGRWEWKGVRGAVCDWVYRGHDLRLWGETVWFILVNGGTMWVFLMKGFEWPQEPGRVQRFMW